MAYAEWGEHKIPGAASPLLTRRVARKETYRATALIGVPPLFYAPRYPLKDEDIAHLWPTRYAHINPYGRYTIDVDGDLPEAGDGLRPLRPA